MRLSWRFEKVVLAFGLVVGLARCGSDDDDGGSSPDDRDASTEAGSEAGVAGAAGHTSDDDAGPDGGPDAADAAENPDATTPDGGDTRRCGREASGLCAGDTCRVLQHDVLDEAAYRNGAPGLAVDDACQPHVVYADAELGFGGVYVTPRAGTWSTEALSMPVAIGSIAVAPSPEGAVLVVDDGVGTVSAWTEQADQWVSETTFAGENSFEGALLRGPDGTLYSDYVAWSGALMTARRVGTRWTHAQVAELGHDADVALSPTGDLHHVFTVDFSSPAELAWSAGRALPELVREAGDEPHLATSPRIAVSDGTPDDPDGTPHVVFGHGADSEMDGLPAVAYATRVAGAWQITPLAEDVTAASCDARSPSGPEDTCAYDYVRYRPLGVVATPAGDVRLLYTRAHFVGTRPAVCEEGAGCHWGWPEAPYEGQLMIAWPEGEGFESQVLAEDFHAAAGRAAMDAIGRIHLIAHRWWEPTEDGAEGMKVEYFLISGAGD